MHLPEELKSMRRTMISSLSTSSPRGREMTWTQFTGGRGGTQECGKGLRTENLAEVDEELKTGVGRLFPVWCLENSSQMYFM